MEENLFELEVGTFNQKHLVINMKKTAKKKSYNSKLWLNVQGVELALREALAKRDTMSTWTLQSLVMEYTIKCRVTENVIDAA
jgi:hypothetical protein